MIDQSIIDEIVKAITDEGARPEYHRMMLEKHRRQWPKLWAALDKLIVAQGTTYTSSRKLPSENELS